MNKKYYYYYLVTIQIWIYNSFLIKIIYYLPCQDLKPVASGHAIGLWQLDGYNQNPKERIWIFFPLVPRQE